MNVYQFEIEDDEEEELEAFVVERERVFGLHHKGLSKSTYFAFLAILVVSALGSFSVGRKTALTTRAGTPDYIHNPYAAQQIQNFREGNGILFNVHITHHGGTSVCGELKENLTAPSFACTGSTGKDDVSDDFPSYMPWSYEETAGNVAIVQKYFQFISWEFRFPLPLPRTQLSDMDFENPNLVTMFVTRDPISRALAGDGINNRLYPNVMVNHNATEEEWWKFAKGPGRDNYALRALTDTFCCDGRNTDKLYLDKAKDLTQRFTFVLDIACLDHGLEKIADILGFEIAHNPHAADDNPRNQHPPLEERIPFPEVYEYMKEENRLAIEFHEWAQSIALVDCDSV